MLRRAAICLTAALIISACSSQSDGEPESGDAEPGAGSSASPGSESGLQSENELPGNRSWRQAKKRAQNPSAMSGYADRSSTYPGETVSLHISTTATEYRVRAYRMGYYDGDQGRLVWKSDAQPGEQQQEQGYDAKLRMPYAEWQPSMTVDTTGWPGGMYLLRLVGNNGAEWLVPLVLRERDVTGKTMIVIPDTTSQAYNPWGDRSAYSGPGGFSDRSRAVSFSRPYSEGYGAGRYFSLAQPLVRLAEQTGLPLAYVAASDLDREKGAMSGTEGVVVLGHDEYWTVQRRRETERVRDSGTDLAFLGANTMYWRTRLGPGPRDLLKMTIYKDAGEDPVNGKNTTVRYRDDPAAEAERSLIGMDYECFPAVGTYVVADPDFFLFQGTNVTEGQRFDGIVNIEVDRAYPLPGTPKNLQIVANNPTDCGGSPSVSNSTYYTTDSGAGVFAAGSIGWITRGLGSFAASDPRNAPEGAKRFVRKVTANLLNEMAAGPMGAKHPAEGNIEDFDLPKTNTTGKA